MIFRNLKRPRTMNKGRSSGDDLDRSAGERLKHSGLIEKRDGVFSATIRVSNNTLDR